MSSLDPEPLVILGWGRASADAPNPHAARLRQVVRYSDPSSWAVVLAAEQAMAPHSEACRAAAERVSVIQLGSRGPAESMERAAADAQQGLASPVRFPASSPSAATGLLCIAFGFRGPTLSLTQPLPQALPTAFTLSTRWLARGVVDLGLIVTFDVAQARSPRAACLLLSRGRTGEQAQEQEVLRYFTSWMDA
ncbi:MAG: coronafacic acid synthetase [Myxococcaceae bacterium]|nr:coronafacic acid synthetase [Myxococcaceae bacterium]